jgi:hypothetical protein
MSRTSAGSARRAAGADSRALIDELRKFLDQHPEAAVRVDWRVVP